MSKIKKDKISSAYHDSKNIYDGVLTQGNIFARAYIRFFWGGTDDVRPLYRAGKNADAPLGDYAQGHLSETVGKGVYEDFVRD